MQVRGRSRRQGWRTMSETGPPPSAGTTGASAGAMEEQAMRKPEGIPSPSVGSIGACSGAGVMGDTDCLGVGGMACDCLGGMGDDSDEMLHVALRSCASVSLRRLGLIVAFGAVTAERSAREAEAPELIATR